MWTFKRLLSFEIGPYQCSVFANTIVQNLQGLLSPQSLVWPQGQVCPPHYPPPNPSPVLSFLLTGSGFRPLPYFRTLTSSSTLVSSTPTEYRIGPCLFLFLFFFLIVVQVQLSPFFNPPCPPSTYPLWLCPCVLYTCSWWPLPYCPSPPSSLVSVSLFFISMSLVVFCLFACFVD